MSTGKMTGTITAKITAKITGNITGEVCRTCVPEADELKPPMPSAFTHRKIPVMFSVQRRPPLRSSGPSERRISRGRAHP